MDNLRMEHQHIIQWRRGLRRYKLLSDWNLSEFVIQITASSFGDVSVWDQISEGQLNGEPLNMNDEQIVKWNDGVQRVQQSMKQMKTLMNDWELGEFADNVINSVCKEVSSWSDIPETELRQEPIRMNDDEIKKWSDGLERYEQQMRKEEEVRDILTEWDLSGIADSMIHLGHIDLSLWHEITEENLKEEPLGMD